MAAGGAPRELREGGASIPAYKFPENAAVALGHATRYGLWRARPPGTVREYPQARSDEASATIAQGSRRAAAGCTRGSQRACSPATGSPPPLTRIAMSPTDAGRIAGSMRGAVALKAIARRPCPQIRCRRRGAEPARRGSRRNGSTPDA